MPDALMLPYIHTTTSTAPPPQALRPRGVRLMHALLAAFGEAPDPEVEGARLLELYQAQIVSTLR